MKKTKIIFKKTNSKLVPEHLGVYFEMLGTIKENEFVEAEYASVKVSKSNDQLGYLFSGIYPFALYMFKDTRGPVLYEGEVMGFKVPIKATIESVDFLFKVLFAQYKGAEFQKRKMKLDEMAEYIKFIDGWCIEHFGYPIPPPKKGDKNERV